MAKIINLKQQRKQRQRREDRAQADQNALSFGLSKTQRETAQKSRDQAKTHLDQHQLDSPKRDP